MFVLSNMAMNRCVNDAKANYTMALMNYTANTKDQKYLTEWLELSKLRYSVTSLQRLSNISKQEINQLSNFT